MQLKIYIAKKANLHTYVLIKPITLYNLTVEDNDSKLTPGEIETLVSSRITAKNR